MKAKELKNLGFPMIYLINLVNGTKGLTDSIVTINIDRLARYKRYLSNEFDLSLYYYDARIDSLVDAETQKPLELRYLAPGNKCNKVFLQFISKYYTESLIQAVDRSVVNIVR